MKPTHLVTIKSSDAAAVTVELWVWEAFLAAQIQIHDGRLKAARTRQMNKLQSRSTH
jgi:hypothetical protein